jgi:predicted small secreted protein
MKVDGTQATVLTNDKVSCLNIMGDWIYYINNSDNRSVYKIKIDGSDRTMLCGGKVINMTVLGDKIYFSVNGGIYKMDLDGSNKKRVVADNIANLNYMNVVGDWIYYVDSKLGYIRKVRTDGTHKTILRKKYSRELNVVAGNIYFTDYSSLDTEWEIYRMDTNGRKETKLFDKVTSNMNVVGNNIIFKCTKDKDEKERIYKIDLKGKKLTKIGNDILTNEFTIAGNWIYYEEYLVVNGYVDYKMRRTKIDASKKEDLEHIIPQPLK